MFKSVAGYHLKWTVKFVAVCYKYDFVARKFNFLTEMIVINGVNISN